MKRRETPEPQRPERDPYRICTIPWMEEDITFCLPSMGVAQETMAAFNEAAKSKDIRRLEGAQGDIFALCWDDPVYALESEGGTDVYDELHVAGWPASGTLNLTVALIEQITANIITAEDVETKVDFYWGRQGANGLKPSPSGTPTAAETSGVTTG
ncbi:hypothetical protein LCGC14_1415860 [marine sediment metagenome]|uniref:Uncharacterized protein n=1 Tax=marine sediment metagenome TaxID=412755 RepID=A0A0F9JSW6_9ZZZZ